jgi:hypothetical protein
MKLTGCEAPFWVWPGATCSGARSKAGALEPSSRFLPSHFLSENNINKNANNNSIIIIENNNRIYLWNCFKVYGDYVELPSEHSVATIAALGRGYIRKLRPIGSSLLTPLGFRQSVLIPS